jgi:hypothetical protein
MLGKTLGEMTREEAPLHHYAERHYAECHYAKCRGA